MNRTALQPSRGANRASALAAAILLGLAAPAGAQQFASGEAAYAARAWDAAEALWQEEAAAGSAEALLGLGNLRDFGLTGPQDPEGAFDYYLRAARAGLSEAAFNIAVMYDSGVGTTADRRIAAGWYGLSALDGYARAQYNLGQVFAGGDGVAENDRLAAYWLDAAAPEVPAAAGIRGALEPEAGDLAPPDPIVLVATEGEAETIVRAAWAAPPGPEDARFRLEIIDTADPAAPPVTAEPTVASAASVVVAEMPDAYAWRVLQLTDTSYAASPWIRADGSVFADPPASMVRFQVAEEDRRGIGYAERVAASLRRSGTAVSLELAEQEFEASSVRFRFDADREAASRVADFLPALDGAGPTQDAEMGLAPGEVLVRLVFAPQDG